MASKRLEWNDLGIVNESASLNRNAHKPDIPYITKNEQRDFDQISQDLMQYAMLAIMIMIPAAITLVIFVVCRKG